MPTPIRIILADDHKIFLAGLAEVIGKMQEVEVVATATNGEEVVSRLETSSVDVAILDVHMPFMDGLAATKAIRQKHPGIKVLILTMSQDLSLIKSILEAGALGYILKTCEREDLEKAIRQVASGSTYLGDEIAVELAAQSMPAPGPAPVKPGLETVELSEREREIVTLVAQGYTSSKIAKRLYISETTVETHRRNALQKLGLKNVANLVKYALKRGWIE